MFLSLHATSMLSCLLVHVYTNNAYLYKTHLPSSMLTCLHATCLPACLIKYRAAKCMHCMHDFPRGGYAVKQDTLGGPTL
jgi:hypothetical protein